MAARYGGEEFACLLPGTDLSGAVMVASAILAAVKDLRIEHHGSNVADVVTTSIGVATTIPTSAELPETLVSAADRQLYTAKSSGRARVCSVSTAEHQYS